MTQEQAKALTKAFNQRMQGKVICTICGEPFEYDEVNDEGMCIDCEEEQNTEINRDYHTLKNEQ